MHAIAREAPEAGEVAIMPGKPIGNVLAVYAKLFDKAGLNHARLNACGYAMGTTFNPIWVDFPMSTKIIQNWCAKGRYSFCT